MERAKRAGYLRRAAGGKPIATDPTYTYESVTKAVLRDIRRLRKGETSAEAAKKNVYFIVRADTKASELCEAFLTYYRQRFPKLYEQAKDAIQSMIERLRAAGH